MEKENFAEFRTKMTAIGELYDKKISDSLLDIYWNALKNLSIEGFTKGINIHTLDKDSGRFFPKPANIYGNVTTTQSEKDSYAKDKAELIWEQVMLAASGRHVEITDRKALAAISAQGGLHRIGMTNYDDLVWVKKEFISSYMTYGRVPVDELPEHLSDVVEARRINEKSTFKLLGIN